MTLRPTETPTGVPRFQLQVRQMPCVALSVVSIIGAILVSCKDVPIIPAGGVLEVAVVSHDSLVVGAPGEPLPHNVLVLVRTGSGRPIPGARVRWEPSGAGSRVTSQRSSTDEDGTASASWCLGTDASEPQVLTVVALTDLDSGSVVLHARAVPHVVAAIVPPPNLPVELRVGDTLVISPDAVDPYGNVFPLPTPTLTADSDSMLEISDLHVIGGPRRGDVGLHVAGGGLDIAVPMHVTQFVERIEVDSTLRMVSLNAEVPVSYLVLDDRGRQVSDTIATVSVSDTSVVTYLDRIVRSVSPGEASVRFEVGAVFASQRVIVRQVVSLLSVTAESLTLAAIGDTSTLGVRAFDGLGNVILNPVVIWGVSDSHVAGVNQGTVTARANGRTAVFVRDRETGVEASVDLNVAQMAVDVGVDCAEREGFSFAAAGDSIAAVWATDRNGFRLPFEDIRWRASDSGVVTLDDDGTVRAARSGLTRLLIEADTVRTTADLAVVLPVEVLSNSVPGFSLTDLPAGTFPGPPTAIGMADGTVNLFFTGYAYDSTQVPPFSGDLHIATSSDGVHFQHTGIALRRDSAERSQGIENVFLVPRDDGAGCRLFAAAGASWWIWQTFSAVADDCSTWTWENGPAVPGIVNDEYDRRGNGEGIYVWQDSIGSWWMLLGAQSLDPQDDRVWTIALYQGVNQRNWEFVRTVFRPGQAGTGTERAVGGPSVVQVAKGLYRMFFMGDDWGIGPEHGRQRVLSAVSRDRLSWVLEGTVLDFEIAGGGPGYPTVVGDLLYYQYRNPYAGGLYLSAARIRQP